MASVTLREVPEELHVEIKRLQLDYKLKGIKRSIQEVYIEVLEKGMHSIKKENSTK